MSFFLTSRRARAFSLLLLILPTLAKANVFWREDRVRADLPGIGFLTRADGSRGTAFLVSRCQILTNLHVASSAPENPDPKESSQFTPVGEEGVSVTARLVVHGGSQSDWALLKLDDCLGDRLGWLKLEASDLVKIQKQDLKMTGFPSDRSRSSAWLDPKCRIYEHSIQRNLWLHDCASQPGSSGSPIFRVLENNTVSVVALNATAIDSFPEVISFYDPSLANGAVPMSEILQAIRGRLED